MRKKVIKLRIDRFFIILMIFEVQRVEVGSKNQSKIDVKNDAETERLGNSIFIDF